ncbi:aldehyde dehydrogenase (NADP(+)) ald6, partial [Coemansia sp. RSA 2607]
MTDIPTLANFIDNTLVPADPSTETLAVTTPHTGATIAHVPLSGAAAVDTAVLSAKRAFPSWSQQTVKSRASVLLRLLTKLQAHSDELAQLIVREHGKTLSEAHGDVSKGLETLEYALGLPQTSQGHVLQVSGGVVCRDERVALGV